MNKLTKKTVFPFTQLFNTLWDEDFYSPGFPLETITTKAWTPSLDIEETDTEYVIRTDLPGLKKTDIKIDTDREFLTISGERKTTTNEKKDGYKYTERFFGTFTRTVRLPHNIEEEKIEATYTDGVLKVSLPKSQEEKIKHITVH